MRGGVYNPKTLDYRTRSAANHAVPASADDWVDWDVSALVPANARAILFTAANDATECARGVRQKTFESTIGAQVILPAWAKISLLCGCDQTKIIQLKRDAVGTAEYNCIGYFL